MSPSAWFSMLIIPSSFNCGLRTFICDTYNVTKIYPSETNAMFVFGMQERVF